MEYIKKQEYNTRIDVYFDGEKYVFINAFFGVVAIARRDGMPDFSQNEASAAFVIEKARTISTSTIERVINKTESRYVKVNVKYTYNDVNEDALLYCVSVKVERR